MKKNIPAGYQVTITSWENDADYYKDEIFQGLSEADAKFLTELCPLFGSYHSYHNPNYRFGGDWNRKDLEERWSRMVEVINEVLAANLDISDGMKKKWTVDQTKQYWKGDYEESISELVGNCGEGYSGNYRRVFESLVVHYFPTEVEDVTSKFSKKLAG